MNYDFTIYDVFEYIRLYRLDGLPYSDNFLKRIDGEIEREILFPERYNKREQIDGTI